MIWKLAAIIALIQCAVAESDVNGTAGITLNNNATIVNVSITTIAPIDAPIDKCAVSANSSIDECLENFVRKWDEIRREKPQVDAIVFPIMAMTQQELKSLCNRIEEAENNCGRAIEMCENHEITRFIQKNFIYACRSKKVSLFSQNSDCLLSTINGQQECLTLLKKSDEQKDQCGQMEEFFKCIHDHVYKSCQAKGLAALVHAIDRFGCDVQKLDARIGKPNAAPACEPAEWNSVATCFHPLLSLWASIRDNDTTYLDTAFPIFKFERSNVVKMCDMVRVIRDRCFAQIQRCPGHQFPEFANSILGLACGTQQSSFFLHYDCIRGAITENDQCQPYTVGAWQPGHLKEVCGRMPQYYKCLEKPIVAKCGYEAVNVLAQTIKQYGCDLNTEGSGESTQQDTTPTAPLPIQTSALPLIEPVTESVLDFAGLPPAPPALNQAVFPQQPVQPFLQDSQVQPLFLAQPIPPAPLLPEVIFNSNLAPAPPSTLDGQPLRPATLPPAPPAPPAAILLEPQQGLAPAPNLPLPDKFVPDPSTAGPSVVSTSTAATSTASSTSASTSTSTSQSTSSASLSSKGAVAPIPNVPQLLQLCNLEKRNQLRKCLNPLYKRWVEVHGKMMSDTHANLSFPIYHYSKNEMVELCEHYASAFLQCPFSLFQECLTDDVVYLANAIFGYVCSPQNMNDLMKYFDCLSNVIRARTQCTTGIEGQLLAVAQSSTNRCLGASQFYTCNK